MTQPKKVVTLAAVIKKIRHISDVHYESKLYDNIVTIFQRLNPTEQRVLLKGLIGMCSTIEDQILEQQGYERDESKVTPPPAVERRRDRTKKEKVVDTFEVIKKSKGWWWKTAVAVILVLFLLGTSFGSFFLTGENGLLARLIHFVEVLKSVM